MRQAQLADGTIIGFEDGTSDEMMDLVVRRLTVAPKQNNKSSIGRKTAIAAKGGVSGLVGGVASIPAAVAQAVPRAPGWLAQGMGKVLEKIGVEGAEDLTSAGRSANQRIADFTKDLTGEEFYNPITTVSRLIDKAIPEYAPRTTGERAIQSGAETLGSFYSPNATYKIGAKMVQEPGKILNAVKRIGVNGAGQAIGATGASIGVGAGEFTENPYLKAALPLLGYIAPVAAAKTLSGPGSRLAGRTLGINPENVTVADAAGMPLSIFNASDNPRVKNVADYMSNIVGGGKLKAAKSEANAVIEARMKDLMATGAQRGAAGRIAQKGMARSIKRDLKSGSDILNEAWGSLPENIPLSDKNIGIFTEKMGKRENIHPALKSYIEKNEVKNLADNVLLNSEPVIPDDITSIALPIQERVTKAKALGEALNKEEAALRSRLENYDGLTDISGVRQKLASIAQAKQQIAAGMERDMGELSSVLSATPRSVNPQDLRDVTRITREAAQGANDDIRGALTKQTSKETRDVTQRVFEDIGGEPLEKFNKGNKLYSVTKDKEEMFKNVLGDESKVGKYGARTVAPEDAANLLHADLLQRPTRYNEAMKLLNQPSQKYLMKYNIQKLGGGEKFNPLEYADNVLGNGGAGGKAGLQADSRRALYASVPGLQEATEEFLKGVQGFRGASGVAGQAKRAGFIANSGNALGALGLGGAKALGASLPGVGWLLGGGIGTNKLISHLFTSPTALRAMAGMNRVGGRGFPKYMINQLNIIRQSVQESGDIPEDETSRILLEIDKRIEELSSAERERQGEKGLQGQNPKEVNPSLGVDSEGGVINEMIKSESNGNPDAENPASSASGILQYTDGTWDSAVKKYKELGFTSDDKNDPNAQKEVTKKLIDAEYEPALRKSGLDIDRAAIYAMHHFGQGDAIRLLEQRDNEDITGAELMPSDVVKDNRNVFYDEKGKARTAKEVVDWLASRVG